MVDGLIFGGIKQGDPLMIVHEIDQLIDLVRVLFIGELLLIAVRKFLEALWIVIPPGPQIRTWCDIFKPVVESCALFADASRPHSVDEHPLTIRVLDVIIDPFNYNLRIAHSCRLRQQCDALSTVCLPVDVLNVLFNRAFRHRRVSYSTLRRVNRALVIET